MKLEWSQLIPASLVQCLFGLFGCADKLAEKHCWLICCERKTLFRLKKKLKSTDYKPDEQDLCRF
jgi:hypothetical protein